MRKRAIVLFIVGAATMLHLNSTFRTKSTTMTTDSTGLLSGKGLSPSEPPPAAGGKPTAHPAQASAGTHTDDSRRCRWRFVQYQPSLLERRWAQNIAYNQQHVCNATIAVSAEARLWVNYSAATSTQSPRPSSRCVSVSPPPQPSDAVQLYRVLSTLEYSWGCEGGEVGDEAPPNVFVPIEPLAGPLRHPFFCITTSNEERLDLMVARDYLVFDRWAAVNVGTRPLSPEGANAGGCGDYGLHAFLFDVGASTYLSGLGGPSQPYFVDWIRSSPCLALKGVYAWEANASISTAAAWDEIPGVCPMPGHSKCLTRRCHCQWRAT